MSCGVNSKSRYRIPLTKIIKVYRITKFTSTSNSQNRSLNTPALLTTISSPPKAAIVFLNASANKQAHY